jgi:hypothetical protein
MLKTIAHGPKIKKERKKESIEGRLKGDRWEIDGIKNQDLIVSPSARLMYGEYWFRLSHLSMMLIGSFASYTKTKSVESAV